MRCRTRCPEPEEKRWATRKTEGGAGRDACPAPCLPSERQQQQRPRARRSNGSSYPREPRAVIIAKLKYERFLGDKGRFQHVGGREEAERSGAQQLQNFISPLLFCRPSAGLPGSLPSGSQDPNVNPRWAVLRSELEPQRSKSPEAGDLCLVLVRQ